MLLPWTIPHDLGPVNARAARAELEDLLDLPRGRWSPMLSTWIDALVVIEEYVS